MALFSLKKEDSTLLLCFDPPSEFFKFNELVKLCQSSSRMDCILHTLDCTPENLTTYLLNECVLQVKIFTLQWNSIFTLFSLRVYLQQTTTQIKT